MAKLQKPKSRKGAVPTMDEASNNLGTNKAEETIKFMSFKVPESFNREFKQLALDQGISLTEMLKRSFHYYRDSVAK